MTVHNDIKDYEKSRLRKFGITMAVVLLIIGSVLLLQDRAVYLYFYMAGGFFLLSGILVPNILYPIEWIWMKLAFIFGYIMTRIILTIVYYLAVTAIGLIRRIFSRDPLDMKIDKSSDSYWQPVDPKGPVSRPYKPY